MKLFVAFLLAPAVFAQQGVKVQGTVVNSISQAPLNKVTVVLQFAGGPKGSSFATETKSGGKFQIEHVPPGKYSINAQRPGFSLQREGPPGTPAKPLVVEGGQDVAVVVKLEPQCVVTGKVTDADGDPLRNASVVAMRYMYVGGKRTLNQAASAQADDRGEYRLFGVPPGKYYIQASNSRGDFISMDGNSARFSVETQALDAPTYYPGTTVSAEASALNLAAGGEARGIDIRLGKQPVFHVRGTMPAPPRPPAPPPRPVTGTGLRISQTTVGMRGGGVNLQLLADSPRMNMGGFPMSMSESNGLASFEFSGVPAGTYTLSATRSEDGHTLHARESVVVSGSDVGGLSLNFVPAFDVTGKIVFEGDPVGKLETMRVRFGPPGNTRGMAVPIGQVQADGTFVAHDVQPERFEINLNTPATAYLKTLKVGSQALPGHEVDFTHGPAVITLVIASDFANIDGVVKDEKGEPVPNVRVTAIPAVSDINLSRFAFTDENGNYKMARVVPGVYKMFAWDKVEVGAPQDPEFRKPYEKQGQELRVESSAHKTVDLTVVHVKDE
jgi:hypothetical protein